MTYLYTPPAKKPNSFEAYVCMQGTHTSSGEYFSADHSSVEPLESRSRITPWRI